MLESVFSRGLVACAFLTFCASVHAQSTTLTFPSGGCNAATSGPSGSFRMEPVQASASCAYQEQGFGIGALTTTPTPFVGQRPGTGATITASDGSAFSFASFAVSDSGRVNTIFDPNSGVASFVQQVYLQDLRVTGYRSDGSTVGQDFAFNGSIVDFETFSLNASFADLTRVEIYTNGAALFETTYTRQPDGSYFATTANGRVLPSNALLDNVQLRASVVTAVPEPGTLLGMVVGLPLLGMWAVRRRREGRG
jgi:hypothetical protein